MSDFNFSKEETVYERLQRIAISAKNTHSQNGVNHSDTVSPRDIDKYVAEQKEKARLTVLLHGATIPI